MTVSRITYPTGISGIEGFGKESCYTLNPDILNLSGRVEMYRIPLWEVPMDATAPILFTFYEIPYTSSPFLEYVINAQSVFVGSFSPTKVFIVSEYTGFFTYPIKIFDDSTGNFLFGFGGHQGLAAPPTPGFAYNWGKIVANSLYIYVLDGSYVQVFDHTGVFQFWFGRGGPSIGPGIPPAPVLSFAAALAIDSTRIYVGESDRVSIFDHLGNFISSFYADRGCLKTVSVHTGGNNYSVGDKLNVLQMSGWQGTYTNMGQVRVDAVLYPYGPVTAVSIWFKGYANSHTVATGVETYKSTGGGGAGCKINITSCEFGGINSITTDGVNIYVVGNSTCQTFDLGGSFQNNIVNSTGAIQKFSLNTGGTGYIVSEVLTLSGGVGGQVKVLKIGPGGVVQIASLYKSGSGYTAGTLSNTTSSFGVGCKISIDECMLNSPKGIGIDSSNVYIGETLPGPTHQISIFDKLTSVKTSTIGPSHGVHKSELHVIRDMCQFGGYLYVTGDDMSNIVYGVQKLNPPTGSFIRRFKQGSQYISHPATYCFTQTNTILIAGSNWHSFDPYEKISETDLIGNVINYWPVINSIESGVSGSSYGPPPSTGYITHPIGIVQSSTRTFITNSNYPNSMVSVFDNSGNYLFNFDGSTGAGGALLYPYSIAVDSTKVYVTDTVGRVQIFDHNGNYITHFDALDSPEGFFSPQGIAVDAIYIYVCDSSNHNVKVFNLSGNYQSTIGTFGSGDGQFDLPTKVEVTNNYIYVLDGGDYLIPDKKDIQVFDKSGNFVFKYPLLYHTYGDIKYHPASGQLYFIQYA